MNYLTSLAKQIEAAVSQDDLPQGDTDSLFVLYAVLALVKGTHVTNEDVHNAWAAWMIGRGDGDHKSLRPYGELSQETQNADVPFVEAIQRVARAQTTS